ncbi:hypothetical protein BB558_005125 [Smittium angustum]|uniref:DUF7137 domain-containing protein n=1 Tax=Smittium angustum TaxID=133377 RepID=A0A2U1J1C0_SMIAN|nr:hypothetical protein BB558_005125 [Smittium angustum]
MDNIYIKIISVSASGNIESSINGKSIQTSSIDGSNSDSSDENGDSSNSKNSDSSGDSDNSDDSGEMDDGTDNSGGNGQPGRITMITPPNTLTLPLFELESKVKLSWKYSNDMTNPPKKLMIIGQMPNNGQFNQPGTNIPLTWNIAVNISGTNYTWDTSAQTPQGISLSAISGYKMIFYDGDIGFKNGSSVHEGQLINFPLSFSMYRSDYSKTNDGVPKNYNPNSSPKKKVEKLLLILPLLYIAFIFL